MGAERVELMLNDAERFARSAAGNVMCTRFPEIPGDDLVFTWDADGPEEGGKLPFVVRHGDEVLWRAVVVRGIVKRFIDVAALLAGRYGTRVRDLVPSDVSRAFLVGDSAEDAAVLDAARERLRNGWRFSDATK